MELKTLSLTFVLFGLLVGCSSRRGDSKQSGAETNASPPTSVAYAVSAVTGPSWLKHLGRTLPQTHMARWVEPSPFRLLGGASRKWKRQMGSARRCGNSFRCGAQHRIKRAKY